MKLLSWNVNSLAVRLPQLLALLERESPDAAVLQETKLVDAKFPHAALAEAGWRALAFGQPTYNGVALLSRAPAAAPQLNLPNFDDPQARVVAATLAAGVRLVGLYVPNGQSVGSDKFAYKLRWLDALRDWLAHEAAAHPRLVVMGDLNIAPADADVHDPAAWAGQVLCTDDERARFRALLDLGFADAFRLFEQPPRTFSWWDYRELGFRRNRGLRIDHALVSAALRERVRACRIDKATRALERPSDHAPVIVEIDVDDAPAAALAAPPSEPH